MKLDLSEIARNVGKRQKYAIDEPCWAEEEGAVGCIGRVSGEVEFANTGRVILVRGRLRANLELECSRCLVKFQAPVEAKIQEQLDIPNYQAGSEEVETEEPEAELEPEPLFVDNIFDLSEFIRQSLILSIPIQPLCSEVCKGLCSQCGENLNVGKCECPEVTESPFAGLAELLQPEQPESKEG